jgi:hypothetical protein
MRQVEERILRQLFREVEEEAGPEIRGALRYMAATAPNRSERAAIERLAELAGEAFEQWESDNV